MVPPILPQISKAAFSCPHCGAYTSQYWYHLWAQAIEGDDPVPNLVGDSDRRFFANNLDVPVEIRTHMLDRVKRHEEGLVLLEERTSKCFSLQAENLHLSKCHHCSKIAVWVRSRMIFPERKAMITPNQDLPEEVVRDFEEAREIVNASPRGAAALLRLCIQKLCIHLLGSDSKDINTDIGTLVKRGLLPTVQEALDIVRVIGNESVHPGTMDLKDDRETAIALFNLVNSIAEQLITHPTEVKRIYSTLPAGKLKGIEDRDKSKSSA
jgi:hypothetical protein